MAAWDACGTVGLETELARVLAHRLDNRRPIIVDGVCILDALNNVGRKADFLILVIGSYEQSSLAPQVAAYRSRRRPDEMANFKIDGYVEN
jgi:hypothetical protein